MKLVIAVVIIILALYIWNSCGNQISSTAKSYLPMIDPSYYSQEAEPSSYPPEAAYTVYEGASPALVKPFSGYDDPFLGSAYSTLETKYSIPGIVGEVIAASS